MHRVALGAICIDVPAGDNATASAFWQGALARTARRGEHHPEFEVLSGSFGGVLGLVQSVGSATPSVHLDLHTDDLDAEVARLVALGARAVERHGSWVVLEDPAGMRFCVVPVDASDPLLEGAASVGE